MGPRGDRGRRPGRRRHPGRDRHHAGGRARDLRDGHLHVRPEPAQYRRDHHEHRRRGTADHRSRITDHRSQARRPPAGAWRAMMDHSLRYLEDRWDDRIAGGMDGPDLLRYRSNLLGADLRITNFGGGNTSAKLSETDPLDGTPQQVLWVKGSGGDLGSIQRSGFATLYLDKLRGLRGRYRGPALEDEMVELYPLCTFGRNPVAASIDTPLHGFLPFAHVDHLHPDWGIALAASANGPEKLDELNQRFGHRLVWLPWQRPGFALAMTLRDAVESSPGCDGAVLGGHGLFTWGDSSRDCYRRTLVVIDHLGQLVLEHMQRKDRALFGGPRCEPVEDHRAA